MTDRNANRPFQNCVWPDDGFVAGSNITHVFCNASGNVQAQLVGDSALRSYPVTAGQTLTGNFSMVMPSNLQLWLTSDRKTVSSGNVTAMTDLSPNGQAVTISGTPTVAAADLAGHDAIVMDGVSAKIATAFTQGFPAFFLAVIKVPAPGAGGTHDVLIDGANAAGLTSCLVVDSTPEYYEYAGSLVGAVAGNPFASAYKDVICVFNGASSGVYVSGTLTASGNDTQSRGNPGGFVLGGSGAGTRFAPFRWVELLAFNKAPTANDIASLHAYASKKYGI